MGNSNHPHDMNDQNFAFSEPSGVFPRVAESQDPPAVWISTDFEGLDELRTEWDELAARTESPASMTYDWCRIWWETYRAPGWQLKIYIFREEQALAGIVPIVIASGGSVSILPKIARLAGANCPPRVHFPPVRSEFAKYIWGEVLSNLLGKEKCDLVSLGLFPEEKAALGGVAGAAGRFQMRAVKQDVASCLSIPGTFEEYLEILGKKEKGNLLYQMRKLQRERQARVEIARTGNLEEEFELFCRMHQKQWRNKGRPGHFGAWPRAQAFHRKLVACLGELDRVRFIKTIADEEVISNQYVFSFGNRYYAELTGRMEGEPWDRYGIGRQAYAVKIQAALEEGKNALEAGLGRYPYKVRMGAKEYDVYQVSAARKSSASVCKLMLFRIFSTMTNWGYHKVWYKRLQPKVRPCRDWPLWRGWINSQV